MGLISGLYTMLAAVGYLVGESTSNQIKRSKHPQMTVTYIREGEDKRYVEETEEGDIDRSELVTHDRLWRLEHAMELDYDSPDREKFDSDFRLNPYLRKLATPEEMQEFRDDVAYIEEIRDRIKNGPTPDGQPFWEIDYPGWGERSNPQNKEIIKWYIYVNGEKVNTQIPVLATTLPTIMENGCWKFGDKETEYKANQYSKELWFSIPELPSCYYNGKTVYPISELLGATSELNFGVRGDGYIWRYIHNEDGEIVDYEKTIYHVGLQTTLVGNTIFAHESMTGHDVYIGIEILKDIPPYYKPVAHGEFEECTSIKATLPGLRSGYRNINMKLEDLRHTMEQVRYDQILAEERPKLLQSRSE